MAKAGEPGRGYRVGADIGGTFTDLVLLAPDGGWSRRKIPSTTDDYSRGIVDGLRELLVEEGLDPGAIDEIVHGTTVATNAILENRGAKTALLTTRGFRDVLEFRRLRVPQLYDLFYRPPSPMVERRLRLGVVERVGSRGEVLTGLDEPSVRAALERIRQDGARAVAVCLLHSYVNPAHERRIGEIVRETLPDVYLSLSVDVLPEVREYERTSTTVINAYVGPVVRSYLGSLQGRLESGGFGARLRIMQSNGGVMSARAAVDRPAQIVESGPAAGVIAGQQLGQRAGVRNLITFDMGGTTAKTSLIEDGQINRTTEYEVGAGISLSSRLVKGGGHALKLPVVDIAEVGAGGGSIIWVDRGGSLKVGPRSAGAVPGPACYGLGGAEPTITDANVVLGYSNPRQLAGGMVLLRAELAEAALRETIAGPLGLPTVEAAYGAIAVANASMIRAIKAVSTYRGRDPRDFTLLAFGGNGPVHAAAIAEALQIPRLIVPPAPGLFSAFGLLDARPEHHTVRTFFRPIATLDPSELTRAYLDLEDVALAAVRTDGYEGTIVFARLADLRYAGQAYELTVSAPSDGLAASDVARLADVFEQEHERTYGHRATGEPVDLVNLRVVARIEQNRPPASRFRGALSTSAESERLAYFGPTHRSVTTPVIARHDLDRTPRPGPFIVEEYDATVVVPPAHFASLDDYGNIVIQRAEDRSLSSPRGRRSG